MRPPGTGPPNQFKNSSNRSRGHNAAETAAAAAIDKENITTIDYHHLGASNQVQTDLEMPSKTLLAFYYERLLAKGRSTDISDEMLHTWRLAGHNQDSILNMIKKNRTPNRTRLRLELVKELSKASVASFPISVHIGELLDETVNYFMPEDRVKIMESKIPKIVEHGIIQSQSSSGNTSAAPETDMRNVSNQQSYDKLTKLSNMLDLYIGPPGSSSYILIYERIESMDNLRKYFVQRMTQWRAHFNISDDYVEEAAKISIKLLAVTNFSNSIMRKHLMSYGSASLGKLISTKTSLYQAHFPPGISAKFIITLVLDYLEEFRE